MFTILRRSVPAVACLFAAVTLAGFGTSNTGADAATFSGNVSTGAQGVAISTNQNELAPAPDEDDNPPEKEKSDDKGDKSKTKPPKTDDKSGKAGSGTATGKPPVKSGGTSSGKRPPIAKPNAASMRANNASQDTSATAGSAPRIKNREANLNVNAPKLDPSEYFMHVEPARLELGEIATGDTGVGSVVLSNDGEVPIEPSARSNCGCTTTGLKKGTILQPGESIEVQIRLKAGQSPRKLSKTVTFMFKPDGLHPPIRVPVTGQGKSFVELVPATLVPDATPKAEFKLKATDKQKFRITSMVPGIIEEFPLTKRIEHKVEFDWDNWRELGSPRRVMFYTDHPRCARITATIRIPRPKREDTRPPANDNVRPSGTNSPVPPGLDPDRERPDSGRTAPPPRTRTPKNKYDDMLKRGRGGDILKLVNEGLDPETRDGDGSTLLGLASQHGDLELMQGLMDAGADVDTLDTWVGATALMRAARGNQVDAIRLLLRNGASLEIKNKMGGTALSWAALFGRSEAVQELVDQGAQIEVVGILTGFTPLIWAAGFGDDPKSIDILLEAGANIEVAGINQGCTPLIHAARTGKPEGVRSLIKHGANLETREFMGRTAFLAACAGSAGTVEKIQILVEAGADIFAEDSQGLNGLDLALKRTDLNSESVIDYLKKLYEEKPKEKEGK